MTGCYYPAGHWNRFTVSEREVIAAIRGEKKLPTLGQTEIKRYKRHEKAITRLKEYGVIYKELDNILYINEDRIINK